MLNLEFLLTLHNLVCFGKRLWTHLTSSIRQVMDIKLSTNYRRIRPGEKEANSFPQNSNVKSSEQHGRISWRKTIINGTWNPVIPITEGVTQEYVWSHSQCYSANEPERMALMSFDRFTLHTMDAVSHACFSLAHTRKRASVAAA